VHVTIYSELPTVLCLSSCDTFIEGLKGEDEIPVLIAVCRRIMPIVATRENIVAGTHRLKKFRKPFLIIKNRNCLKHGAGHVSLSINVSILRYIKIYRAFQKDCPSIIH
jgi:hypothetical protein